MEIQMDQWLKPMRDALVAEIKQAEKYLWAARNRDDRVGMAINDSRMQTAKLSLGLLIPHQKSESLDLANPDVVIGAQREAIYYLRHGKYIGQ